jgi:predicted metalloprotease with PDZ domain
METYANKGIGFPEDGFLNAVETVAGSDFHEFFEAVAQSHRELDYNRYLKQAGLVVDIQLQPGTIYVGIGLDSSDGNRPRITRVAPNSPAERGKLDAGDVLIAMNDDRLTFDNSQPVALHSIGETIKLTG